MVMPLAGHSGRVASRTPVADVAPSARPAGTRLGRVRARALSPPPLPSTAAVGTATANCEVARPGQGHRRQAARYTDGRTTGTGGALSMDGGAKMRWWCMDGGCGSLRGRGPQQALDDDDFGCGRPRVERREKYIENVQCQ